MAYAILVAIKVHQFVTTGSQTYQEANHLTNSTGLLALQLVGQGSALLLAVGFALVSLTAMRQGLLTRFMGYLGIFAGVLVLFQITQIPVVQGYWLVAVAYLISGRWPTGLPARLGHRPGRAVAAVRGDAGARGRPRRRARTRRRGPHAGAQGRAPARGRRRRSVPARTRSATPKRKRKRRSYGHAAGRTAAAQRFEPPLAVLRRPLGDPRLPRRDGRWRLPAVS